MRRILALILLVTATSAADAGFITTTFESNQANNYFPLSSGNFSNNPSPDAGFSANGNFLNNTFDSDFGVWLGWAISQAADTTTGDFTNLYSAITGSGANGSATYAVADTLNVAFLPSGEVTVNQSSSFINLAPGTTPHSVDITNTTYAYTSMHDGDQFAKQFGAGDFFNLDITGYEGASGTGSSTGVVHVPLASGQDILTTWETVDLTSLGAATSLVFGLTSSDNDPTFGLNQPAFFALDNLVAETTDIATTPEPASLTLMAAGLMGLASFSLRKRLCLSDK